MNRVCHIEAASLRFGKVSALNDVSLTIQAGERVALIGSNGSGKSTLLRLVHGLIAPSVGIVQVHASLKQAMLFQRPYLMRTSCLNNASLGLWLRGTPWREAKVHGLAALAKVELTELAHRSARTLSGGQQQRLAFARAWAMQPDVLLLDEPTANLDPHAKREVEALMAALSGAMTLIFASHNLGQVKRLATRVIYLEAGRILADLPVSDFFKGDLLQTAYPAAHLFVKGETA
jgi:tungstate transport system ATP-binding protein